jgi:formamidopyrimidine-DNA glycosylase
MPEGPEIKFLGELCRSKLINYNLVDIISNSKTKIKLPQKSKLINLYTKGKLLVLIFTDFYFHIHFGLTGWLMFEDSKYPKYVLIFKKDNIEQKVFIDDIRRFSKLRIIKEENKHNEIINKLGIDILTEDFTIDFFMKKIKGLNKLLVALLLDQNEISGIGNYIKNESLYISHIDPHRKTSSLSDKEINDLYTAIKYVSYSNLVEQLLDDKLKVNKLYKSIKISVPYKLRVYEQEEDPKGNKVIIENISGRRSFYVKEIQK